MPTSEQIFGSGREKPERPWRCHFLRWSTGFSQIWWTNGATDGSTNDRAVGPTEWARLLPRDDARLTGSPILSFSSIVSTSQCQMSHAAPPAILVIWSLEWPIPVSGLPEQSFQITHWTPMSSYAEINRSHMRYSKTRYAKNHQSTSPIPPTRCCNHSFDHNLNFDATLFVSCTPANDINWTTAAATKKSLNHFLFRCRRHP